MGVDTWGEPSKNQKKKVKKALKDYSKVSKESPTEFHLKRTVLPYIKYSLVIFGVLVFIYMIAQVILSFDFESILSEFQLPSWFGVWIWMPWLWIILWFAFRSSRRRHGRF